MQLVNYRNPNGTANSSTLYRMYVRVHYNLSFTAVYKSEW